jgi:hypothetical protein
MRLHDLMCLLAAGCTTEQPSPTHAEFTGSPELVTIEGYSGLTEDPFITSDGNYLLFDSAGDVSGRITLHYARSIDYKTFSYQGELQGLGADGGAAPAIDTAGELYFLSGRSYAQDFSSIWHGRFTDGVVTELEPVAGISKQQTGWFNMGATPDRDGTYLVFSDNGPRAPSSPTLPDAVSHVVIATRNADGTFTRVDSSDELMANVNTARDIVDFSYGAVLASDDLEIFFTAPGFTDTIYVARRDSVREPFGVARPVHTGRGGNDDGLAEGPTISVDGAHLYYHEVTNSHTAIYVLSR